MFGLTFLMSIKQVSQSDIARMLHITPQTVNKWVKQIRPIPDEHQVLVGKKLGVDPIYLARELSLQEMVYLLSGEWLISEQGEFSIPFRLLQQQCVKQEDELTELRSKVRRMEEEANKIWRQSSTLSRNVYQIEDDEMKKCVRSIFQATDHLINIARGTDQLIK